MKLNDKKRLLMIFYRPPFPLIGGDKIRMFQNLKILSNYYKVDVIFINDNKTDKTITDNILKFAKNVFVFEFTKQRFYLSTLFGLIFNKKPLQVNYYYFKKVQNWINKNISNYDAVLCHTIRAAEYVKNKPIFKIIDFVDAISMNYEKAAKKADLGLWKLLYNIDKSRVLNYELEMMKLFDRKIIISEIDRNFIINNTIASSKISIVQNAVEVQQIRPIDIEENYIVFVGKMDYEPNVSAVTHFSLKIFPNVTKKFPDLKFYIVGVNPTKKVKALSKNINIKVFGYIENLDDVILRSKLVVAPMISGAGIQNKILMAMAMGKCVLTTKIGAEGLNNLGETSNKPLEIAASTEEFIDKLVELLQNDLRRKCLGDNAYKYIKNHFSFNKVEQDLLSVLNIESNLTKR